MLLIVAAAMVAKAVASQWHLKGSLCFTVAVEFCGLRIRIRFAFQSL